MATLRRILLALLLTALLLPPAQVLLLRWVDPPLTLTMLEAARRYDRWPQRDWRSLAELGQAGPRAVVAAEDARFWLHRGFDWEGICRAVEANADREEGERPVGGSTITQQVARNVFLWQEPSWLRKGLETVYAVWMELLLPKERILEVYLNVAEVGIGQFGLQAGARYYFGVDAERLSAEQAALLAAVLPSPRRWDVDDAGVQARAARIAAHAVPWPGSPGFDAATARWRAEAPGPLTCWR